MNGNESMPVIVKGTDLRVGDLAVWTDATGRDVYSGPSICLGHTIETSGGVLMLEDGSEECRYDGGYWLLLARP